MKDLLRRLGQRIRDLRSQQGLSQEEFADVCGVHRTYMGHLERGEKNISFGSILRVAGALHITLSTLFSGFEDGESLTIAQPNPKVGRANSRADQGSKRELLVREFVSLERSIRMLKAIALTQPKPARKSARPRDTQRSARKRSESPPPVE